MARWLSKSKPLSQSQEEQVLFAGPAHFMSQLPVYVDHAAGFGFVFDMADLDSLNGGIQNLRR